MKNSLIKTEEEIRVIAEGGKILAQVLHEVAGRVTAGVTTYELNEFAEKRIKDFGAVPSFKGYEGPKGKYPAGLCTSVNSVVVHGIPSKSEVLKNGDIIGLDCGVIYKGLYTDSAITVPVGSIAPPTAELIEITRRALEAGIFVATPGNHIGDIGYAIQTVVEKKGFSVVRDLIGHGVGYAVHEEPAVPCFGKPGLGMALEAGMVLAIEPMVNRGDWRVVFSDDGWTVRTADGSVSAHFEHTIAITKDGAIVLTSA